MDLISNYSQPEFYRFSEDSISLSNAIVRDLKDLDINIGAAADFCCGCGVVLLEVIQKLQLNSSVIDFYELQEEYLDHIKANSEIVMDLFSKNKTTIYIDNLLRNRPRRTYDLIVMNPPYFKRGNGRPAKDKRTQVCREFGGNDFDELIRLASESLSEDGRFYFVCRESREVLEDINEISKQYKLERISSVKSYGIYLILSS